jgi:ABC-type multidrug transport system ATPase subunit
MSEILSINGLTKRYGSITAIDGLDLTIEKGNVYGLLGPNGSGKTTTLAILLDIIKPGNGTFKWFGHQPTHLQRRRIGATLENPIFYPYLSAMGNLKVIASIKNKPYNDLKEKLKMVGLYDRRHSKFKTYSMGMKQRLAIASALIGNPEVMIFDEPTNGLDPQGIAEIRDLIIQIAGRGQTVILASHLLDEVQKTCSHVAVLRKGKKLFSGLISDLSKDSDLVELSSENIDNLALALQEIEGVEDVKPEGSLLLVKTAEHLSSSQLNEALFAKGIALSHLNHRKISLEKEVLKLLME